MTPQLYAKLSAQAARQSAEASALEAQALALQPGIDSAQSAVDAAQAALDAVAEGDDKTAAQATLDAAKAELATAKEPQNKATAHAQQIRAQIAQCNAAMTASGLSLTPAEVAAIRAAPAVPKTVTRRQAKTIMQLTPHAVHGDLWQAAIAAAGSIPDAPTRIVTTNYLLESLNFEHPKVLAMAAQLLGMTAVQVDALFVSAATL